MKTVVPVPGEAMNCPVEILRLTQIVISVQICYSL